MTFRCRQRSTRSVSKELSNTVFFLVPKDLVEVVNAYKQRTKYEELDNIENLHGGKYSHPYYLSHAIKRSGGIMLKAQSRRA